MRDSITGRMRARCPECGGFVANLRCIYNQLDGIKDVRAECKTHGTIYPLHTFDGENWGWSWEDFFPEGSEE